MTGGGVHIDCPRCGETISMPYTLERSPVSHVGEIRYELSPDRGPLAAHIATHTDGPGPGLRIAS